MKLKRLLGIGLISLCLTGCGEANPAVSSNDGNSENVYSLKYENMDIVPGGEFSREKFGQEESYAELTSCAFDGKDKVYTYSHYEIQTFLKDNKEYVLSVYFLDPSVSTTEGLTIGDEKEKVFELYGNDYKENGASYEFTKGNTSLKVILQGDFVGSIEYAFDVNSLK